MAGFVGNLIRQAVLAFFRGLQLDIGDAFRAGGKAPILDLGFGRLAVGCGAIRDFQQPQFSGAFHRFAIEATSGEVGFDGVADAIVTAVDPPADLERLASDQHVARADDRAARLIDDFGFNRIAVVVVGVKRFCK
jgi:hypothetical protein